VPDERARRRHGGELDGGLLNYCINLPKGFFRVPWGSLTAPGFQYGMIGSRRHADQGDPMTELVIRTISVHLTETLREAGVRVDPPTRKVVAAAVIENPLADGHLHADLSGLEALGAEVAAVLVTRALEVLGSAGVAPDEVRGYGKGAIVGVNGELEHSAAILHPRFGAPVRSAIGGGADIIPGTKTMGGPGGAITMPIGNKDDRWVFDDMDSAEISIPDAPRAGEILVALVLASGGRPNARVKKPGA
jgi:hypothetical protein